MAISDTTVAEYAPWGNAQLAFELPTGYAETDAATGNAVQTTENVEYLAALNIEPPNWEAKTGADETTYTCSGRLLSPSVLDRRITNGMQAKAVINGFAGRFEVVFDLSDKRAYRRDVRQSIRGTFRVVGGFF